MTRDAMESMNQNINDVPITPPVPPPHDESDDAVFLAGIMLADAAVRFLARRRTQRVIEGGLLDDDVVRDLMKYSDEMQAARLARRNAAQPR